VSRGVGSRERGDARWQRAIDGMPAARREPLSHVEAARQGGLATLDRYGTEHFRELGKLGFAVTAERYGRDFAHDVAAAARAAHPERASHDEQRMMQMLAELGQGDLLAGAIVSYRREYKVAARTHVDFAWLDERKALEVYGGVHRVVAFDPAGHRAQREAEREARIRAAGWDLLTVTDRDLTTRSWSATSDRLAAFLGVPPVAWLTNERERPV
jgi:very-short-patch-repair endonuclease